MCTTQNFLLYGLCNLVRMFHIEFHEKLVLSTSNRNVQVSRHTWRNPLNRAVRLSPSLNSLASQLDPFAGQPRPRNDGRRVALGAARVGLDRIDANTVVVGVRCQLQREEWRERKLGMERRAAARSVSPWDCCSCVLYTYTESLSVFASNARFQRITARALAMPSLENAAGRKSPAQLA